MSLNPELVVELIGRRGCHLCDEMKATVTALQRERPFALRLVDVDSDPGLILYYSHRVPVLRVDGKTVAELRASDAELRQRLFEDAGLPAAAHSGRPAKPEPRT